MGSPRRQAGGGGIGFLLKMPRGGGVPGGGGAGRVSAANWGTSGTPRGGGAKYIFFRARSVLQVGTHFPEPFPESREG